MRKVKLIRPASGFMRCPSFGLSRECSSFAFCIQVLKTCVREGNEWDEDWALELGVSVCDWGTQELSPMLLCKSNHCHHVSRSLFFSLNVEIMQIPPNSDSLPMNAKENFRKKKEKKKWQLHQSNEGLPKTLKLKRQSVGFFPLKTHSLHLLQSAPFELARHPEASVITPQITLCNFNTCH